MNCDKTFILGIGCQKGGTSWLYSQLKLYENINLGFCKEYHHFDTFYLEGVSPYKRRWMKSLKKGLKRDSQAIPDQDILRHLLFAQDENAYYQYFDSLWSSDEKISIVGDITPSYNALRAEHFRHIKKKLEAQGFTVKVIFFMRDPVERIWSGIRMKKRLKLRRGVSRNASDNDAIMNAYKSFKVHARTRYDLTILNLEQAFDPGDIFYCLFEDLFTLDSTNKLQSFLGLDANNFNIDTRVNASPKKQEIDTETKREVANYYREVYDFVAKRFPIDGRWLSYDLLKD